MVTVLELEKAAARLRRELKAAVVPEIRLLCGLSFGAVLGDAAPEHREAYLREFLPALAEAASRCDRAELLPEELESLRSLVGLLEAEGELRGSREVEALAGLLLPRAGDETDVTRPPVSADGRAVRVKGLFVEYYPDLDLPPRGRLLTLRVVAMALPGSADEDDVVVRNPVSDPDDRFLAQARDSVAAARLHLARRYGWSGRKRYRFDFTVESSGARFTGDSLGVAFAVGAVAALGRIEALREEIGVNPSVAFCGAMAAHGELAPVDADALKLKVYRGFWSDLKVLVIPRVHITEAWAFLKELEKEHPGRKLELMGADVLDDLAGDPRLLPVRRLSVPGYFLKKGWKNKKLRWVEVPMLLLLLYAMSSVVYPKARWWFDWDPDSVVLRQTGFDIVNRDHVILWSVAHPQCEVARDQDRWLIHDLNHDGHDEVIVSLAWQCRKDAQFQVYASDGSLIFIRPSYIAGEYPGDPAQEGDSEVAIQYPPAYIRPLEDTAEDLIVTSTTQSYPSRAHIKIWSLNGSLLGWYINAGSADVTPKNCLTSLGDRIVLGGINNPSKCAAMFVIPRTGGFGAAPPYWAPDYDLGSVKRGNQICYILFPRTDLCVSTQDLYNAIEVLSVDSGGLIRVVTNEGHLIKESPQVYYSVDPARDYRAVAIDLSDRFKNDRSMAAKCDALTPLRTDDEWTAYETKLLEAVTYWTDSGWVTEGALRAAGR